MRSRLYTYTDLWSEILQHLDLVIVSPLGLFCLLQVTHVGSQRYAFLCRTPTYLAAIPNPVQLFCELSLVSRLESGCGTLDPGFLMRKWGMMPPHQLAYFSRVVLGKVSHQPLISLIA